MPMRRVIVYLMGFALLAGISVGWGRNSLMGEDKEQGAPASKSEATKNEATYRTESLRGRVVWLAEAMKRRYGVDVDADAAQWDVALETNDGQILPIVKDARGRGFRLDPRLR